MRARHLFPLFSLAACGGVDLDFSEDIPEQQLRGSPVPIPLVTIFEERAELDFGIDGRLRERAEGPLAAAFIDGMYLEITPTHEGNGDTDDFAFIQSVDVYIESLQPDSNLERAFLGSATGPGGRRLDFEVDRNRDVLGYLVEGAALTSEASGTIPEDDLSFAGEVSVRLEALND